MSYVAHVTDDLELYAVAALSDADAAAVAAHLERCASCRAAYEEISEVVGQLPDAVPGIDPPASLRERILVAARAETPSRARALVSRRLWQRIVPLGMAATIALLIGVDASASLRMSELQDNLRMASRADRSWYMAGTEQWKGTGGTLIVPSTTDRRPFVLFHDLRPLAEGELYSVWLITAEGRWHRATNFRPDGDEFQLVELGMALSGYDRCAVTIERSASGRKEGPTVMQSRIAPAQQ